MIVEPFSVEQAQIFKLSFEIYTHTFVSLLIINIKLSSYGEIPKFS